MNGEKTKRVLTEREEQVLRLVHQDFGGLSIKEAAKRLGIKPASVRKRLQRAERKAPQLFPILSPLHREILDNISFPYREQTASDLGISLSKLDYAVGQLYRWGYLRNRTAEQYNGDIHDAQIREKF